MATSSDRRAAISSLRSLSQESIATDRDESVRKLSRIFGNVRGLRRWNKHHIGSCKEEQQMKFRANRGLAEIRKFRRSGAQGAPATIGDSGVARSSAGTNSRVCLSFLTIHLTDFGGNMGISVSLGRFGISGACHHADSGK